MREQETREGIVQSGSSRPCREAACHSMGSLELLLSTGIVLPFFLGICDSVGIADGTIQLMN